MERFGDANVGAMVESVVYGARHSAGGGDHLRSAGDDPGDPSCADAGWTGGGGGGVLFGADRRAGYVELAGEPFAAFCGVRADCGVSVGDPACALGCGAAGKLSARIGGGGGFLRRHCAGGKFIFAASNWRIDGDRARDRVADLYREWGRDGCAALLRSAGYDL